MTITLNKKLNFVIPIECDNDDTIYTHSTPIRSETFDAYFEVIGRAYTQIFAGGYGANSGPRLAKKFIRKTAEVMKMWDGPLGVKAGLFDEIYRLTNVVYPTDKGWQLRPFEDAIRDGMINEQDQDEVENALCFFTLCSVMLRRTELKDALEFTGKLWGSQVELLNATEFAASLPTSTTAESIGEKVKPLSIPS